MAGLAGQFMKRLEFIMDQEKVQYEPRVVAELIMKYAPDWRRVINEIQRLASSNDKSISAGVLSSTSDSSINPLVVALKEKNFKQVRSWVVNNQDVDTATVFRKLYDSMNDTVQPQSIPQLVLILADYQYKDAFVADHELNMVACMVEIMASVNFV